MLEQPDFRKVLDTNPKPKTSGSSTVGVFTIGMILGGLMALAFVFIGGYSAWWFGYINFGELEYQSVVDKEAEVVLEETPEPEFVIALPENVDSATETPLSTPTPSVSTPDLSSTATAACEDFEFQFPGTPCP
jgi:hypothetical protein